MNADANITCDFGYGDISRSRSFLSNTCDTYIASSIIVRLAGYPASLGTLPLPISHPFVPPFCPPSLGLPGFGQNICSVIAQNNSIPEIHLKKWCFGLVTLTFSPYPLTPVGEGIQKYRFSRQFMKCPRHLKCLPIKLPTPVGWA